MRLKNQIALAVLAVSLAFHFQGVGNPDHPSPFPPTPGSDHLVMVVAESAPSPPYTPDQFLALSRIQNGDIRAWVDANYAKDGLRVFDPDTSVADQTKVWQEGFNPKESTPPFVKTYNGRRWYKPVPFKNADELNKAIGNK